MVRESARGLRSGVEVLLVVGRGGPEIEDTGWDLLGAAGVLKQAEATVSDGFLASLEAALGLGALLELDAGPPPAALSPASRSLSFWDRVQDWAPTHDLGGTRSSWFCSFKRTGCSSGRRDAKSYVGLAAASNGTSIQQHEWKQAWLRSGDWCRMLDALIETETYGKETKRENDAEVSPSESSAGVPFAIEATLE